MSERLAKRVLLIGWDAADWQIIDQLMADDKMPALKRLIERGARGNLATIQPALSPMLWTSIATAKRADKHGIHGFLEPVPDGTGVRPVSSTSRKCKALWNIAHQNNLRSLVVSWYASHPAEPIRGAVVSDRFLASGPTPVKHGVSPADLLDDLSQYRVAADEITPEELAPFLPCMTKSPQPDLSPKDEKAIGALANILAHSASVQATATRLMLTQEWDLGAVFFDGLDHLGHYFMPYHPPQRPGVPDREFQLFKDVVSGGYRFFDMMLEAILAHAREETTVILVSDHGFKSDELRPQGGGWERPVDWHRQMGIAVASGPGIEKGEVLYGATVLDVTPTILHLLGVPIGRDMDGRPWLEIMETRVSVDKVESWEDVPGDAGLHSEELREDPAESLAMIQQLVELGYVAPLSDDAEATIKQTLRDNQINLALSLFGSQRAATARPIVEDLLEQYPEESLILSMAARMELSEGNAAKVREFARRSEVIEGRNATILAFLAEAALLEEDGEQAIALFQEAIDLSACDATLPALYCRLGDTLAQLSRFDEAEKSYQSILEIDSDHAPAWIGLSKLSLRRGDAEEAVDHATRAVSLIHVYPEAHLRLGEALYAANREADAVTALEVCATLAPGIYKCNKLLAKLKRQLGHGDAEIYASRAKSVRFLERGY